MILNVFYFFIIIQILLIIKYFYIFINKYFLTEELNLIDRYGKDTWVLITGSSSGQGKIMAIEFAKRGFNIILVGRKNIYLTEKLIKSTKLHANNIKTHCIEVDFYNAHKKNFFKPIIKFLNTIPNKLSILVNNVGSRSAWKPYTDMPNKLINGTIICGTIVQSQLTKIALTHFKNRKEKSAIINITTQCIFKNIWFGETGEISVPYMSVYEASNAFGYYHSQSISKEYENKYDILNITPGAVITENTMFLNKTPFAVDANTFVNNIFKLLGNYNGANSAHWGHEISNVLCNFMGGYKNIILENVGKVISSNLMKT